MDKMEFCDKFCPVPARWVEFPKVDSELTVDCDCDEDTECPFRGVDMEKVQVNPVGGSLPLDPPSVMDEEPVCECGDFQISHENGTGKCFICAWNPVIRGEPCQEFKEV